MKESINSKSVSDLLWMILIILPAMITPYPPWDMYNLPKVIALWILSPILLYYIFKSKLSASDWVNRLTLILLILLVVATFYSIDIQRAFWGTRTWREGVVILFTYVFLFILAREHMRFEARYLKFYVFVASLLSIYAILQLHQIDPLNDGYSYPLGLSIVSFGNRNIYGSYALLYALFATVTYILNQSRFSWIILILSYAGLLCSATRGCWLTYMVCLIVIVLLKINKDVIKRACYCLVMFFTLFHVLDVTSQGVLSRRVTQSYEDLNSGVEAQGSFRIMIWKRSLSQWKHIWLIGSGPDTLDLVFKKYDPESYIDLTNRVKLIEKAHNEYIQMIFNAGIFYLLIYLIFVCLAAKNLWQRRDDTRWFCVAIVLMGYLIQAFFNISTVGVAPFVWVLLGVSLGRQFFSEKFIDSSANEKKSIGVV